MLRSVADEKREIGGGTGVWVEGKEGDGKKTKCRETEVKQKVKIGFSVYYFKAATRLL